MPELPEVETVRAGIAAAVMNSTITSLEIFDSRCLRRHPGTEVDFANQLTGAKLLAAVRRGKFLWLPLRLPKQSEPVALMIHLGMSGQVLLRPVGAPEDKLTRAVITISDSNNLTHEIRFIDQRLFGSLAIDPMIDTADGGPGGYCPEIDGTQVEMPWQRQIPSQAAHIARDPLDPRFDQKAVVNSLHRKHTGIKRAILDQNLISGVGNIYADESLWLSRLHYEQPTDSISTRKLNELLENIRAVLKKAVAAGGTSFDEQYKNVNGESGYFAVDLNAYGQSGKPCTRCGKLIRREAWANRGSHFCPNCQRLR